MISLFSKDSLDLRFSSQYIFFIFRSSWRLFAFMILHVGATFPLLTHHSFEFIGQNRPDCDFHLCTPVIPPAEDKEVFKEYKPQRESVHDK
jgi:hypothetical protein